MLRSFAPWLFLGLLVAPAPQLLLAAPKAEEPAAPPAPPPAKEHAGSRKSARLPEDISLSELPEDLSLNDLEPRPPPLPAITDVTNKRCADYYCSIELCLPIEDCDGIVLDNATECGCCPLCIKYMDEGRACGRHGVLRFPERPTTICRPPLRCVAGYCAKGDGPLRRGAKPSSRHDDAWDAAPNAIDQ